MVISDIRATFARVTDNHLVYDFLTTPSAVFSAAVMLLFVFAAFLAEWVSPHHPFDLASISLFNANIPPAWSEGGSAEYLLGTDQQGRDVLSAIIYGSRVSLMVAFFSNLLAMMFGVALGLISGFAGGRVDALIMRIADVQLSFPAILIALLVEGLARSFLPRELHDNMAIYVIVFSIGIANWVQFARTVRASTMVEKRKEYVQAARILQRSRTAILFGHILPNVMQPVLVITTVGFGLAIIIEATLSFLGVGVPASEPSLGTLIRTGNDYLFAGSWWMTIFPGAALLLLVLSINLLGDWLRDALNPRLR